MTGENKFFKYLKIVIGFLVAILFLLPIFILLMDSFKNQKGILTDVLGCQIHLYLITTQKLWRK